jgi:tetratricopeptide (TPR) repeat protein
VGASESPGDRVVEAYMAGIGGDDEVTRRALLAVKNPSPGHAVRYAELGLAEQASALADRIPEGAPAREAWRALSEWRAGRPEVAIPIYERYLASIEARDSDEAYLLGRMLADAGRCGEAVVEFDRLPRLFPWVFAQGEWLSFRMPLALLESARCNEKLERPEQARERLDRLLALWKDADPDLPALAEAKAMRARLGPGDPSVR